MFQNLLADTQTEIIEKDQEIFRLTKEVVELRLLKAGGSVCEKEEKVDSDKPSQLSDSSSQKRCSNTSSTEVTSTSDLPSSSSTTSAATCHAKDVHDHVDMPYNGGG